MRVLSLAIVATLLIQKSFGQDKIITHANDTINCKVIETQEISIKYKYPNEDVINSISNNVVHKIIFSSGREQIISEKIVINGEKDWEKVQITNLESEIIGLKKIKTFAEKAKGTTWTNQGKLEKKVMTRIKKDAAKAGCHIVLILTENGKSGGFYSSATSSMTAIGYSY